MARGPAVVVGRRRGRRRRRPEPEPSWPDVPPWSSFASSVGLRRVLGRARRSPRALRSRLGSAVSVGPASRSAPRSRWAPPSRWLGPGAKVGASVAAAGSPRGRDRPGRGVARTAPARTREATRGDADRSEEGAGRTHGSGSPVTACDPDTWRRFTSPEAAPSGERFQPSSADLAVTGTTSTGADPRLLERRSRTGRHRRPRRWPPPRGGCAPGDRSTSSAETASTAPR